jgi:putative exosortase-associated protein (TIGR04073 family)
MKLNTLLVLLLAFATVPAARSDIHDPPSNDQGPTRKLGRGIANLLFGSTEIPVTIGRVNKEEGNAAAASYGVVRGVGRSAARHVVGLAEILTFPFPLWHSSYGPYLPSDTRYIHAGYSEFPPEPGNETKYIYVRDY